MTKVAIPMSGRAESLTVVQNYNNILDITVMTYWA